jgi:diguanylate cyclase (GGDEF)-like protein
VAYSLDTILSSERLPSLPEVAARVVQIARDPDPDFERLTEAVRMDPAIAGRILKTANSALLGMRTRASSIESAIPRLGTTMVRTLVLSFCVAELQNRNSVRLRPHYQRLWRESLMQAAGAEALAERQAGKVDAANWFLAGLLQDIGRLALLHTCDEQYVEHVLEVHDDRSQREREQDWLGFTHVDVSMGLCRRWNLDPEIIEAIGVHHVSAHRIVPLKFISSTSLPAAMITSAHISEYLEEVLHNLTCNRADIERLLMQVYALRPNEVFRVLADVDQRVSDMSILLGIDTGKAVSLESILTEAQELLAQIAVAGQLRLVNARTPVAGSERTLPEVGTVCESRRETQWRDPLTGAFTRAWLEPALDSTIAQAHEHQVGLGLMFVDLDEFTHVNESAGSQKGDHLLQRTSQVLRQSVRLADSVVRYGGDEFVITLKDINLDLLALLAERLVESVRTELSGAGVPRPVTCSIGAVFYEPQNSPPRRSEVLIREADQAMKQAQVQGGNRVVVLRSGPGRAAQPANSVSM